METADGPRARRYRRGMKPISYAGHRFSPEVIRHEIWLYLRFTLSYRDVEEMLAERGLEVSYETVRRWVVKFGPVFARNLRRLRPRSTRCSAAIRQYVLPFRLSRYTLL